MNEVHLLGSLTHPNIMRFCAVCLDPPMIVMQYYAHGSLFEMLKRAHKGDKRAHKELSWTKRLSMLRDVAAGMSYLHSRVSPHRDTHDGSALRRHQSCVCCQGHFGLLLTLQCRHHACLSHAACMAGLGPLTPLPACLPAPQRPPVIHGDLRSPNLLLDLAGERSERPRFHLKIADFGLAKMLGTSMSIPLTKSSNPRCAGGWQEDLQHTGTRFA